MNIFKMDINMLSSIEYCINCTDGRTGMRGTFAYGEDLFSEDKQLVSISPVFDDVMDFYLWARVRGFRYHSLDRMFTICRDFC